MRAMIGVLFYNNTRETQDWERQRTKLQRYCAVWIIDGHKFSYHNWDMVQKMTERLQFREVVTIDIPLCIVLVICYPIYGA